MNHFSFELALVAVLPAIALCAYVFFKDRAEKEPIGLLAFLFGAGVVWTFLRETIPWLHFGNFCCIVLDKDKLLFSALKRSTSFRASAHTGVGIP